MADGKARLRAVGEAAKPAPSPGAGAAPPRSRGPRDSIYGLPPGCPITPLGMMGKVRYYLDAKAQLTELAAKEHQRSELIGLFGHNLDFVLTVENWRRVNAKGLCTGEDWDAVAKDLIIACGLAPMWDPSRREHGRGAHRGPAGELIQHLGDRILVIEPATGWAGRRYLPPGLVDDLVYPATDPTPRPSEEPAPRDAGQSLLDLLRTWNWRRGELDAVLLLGWIGAAMIGGALRWRPSGWLTGGRATGKSSLQYLIKSVLGDALIDLADTSAAFIWQTLRQQTLPVSVDELEASEDNRKVMGVIQLARIAASGGRLGRGSDKHVPIDFRLQSPFLFSSILIPPLNGADRSRMAVLNLDRLPEGAVPPDLDRQRLMTLGAQLRRRMLDQWGRFETTLEGYRGALRDLGHEARGQDQFGTLLACADMLLFGAGEDNEASERWLAQMQVSAWSETADDVSDEMHCLQHLLTFPVDAYKSGERNNFGEWINRAAGRGEFDEVAEARRVLAKVGVRVETDGQGLKWVAIANQHGGLHAVYERTRWQTPRGMKGVWTQALERLPGAAKGQQPLYFGGGQSRAVLVPLDLVPLPDATAQSRLEPVS